MSSVRYEDVEKRFGAFVALHRLAIAVPDHAFLALLALLVAAPGIHLFEMWLDARVAFYISHGLALALLALIAWRWRASRSGQSGPV